MAPIGSQKLNLWHLPRQSILATNEKTFSDRGSRFKMTREIPIIDFSSFDSDNKKLRNSVAKKVHEAASKVGFMYVKNININEKVMKEAFNSSANFFSLPDKKKERSNI